MHAWLPACCLARIGYACMHASFFLHPEEQEASGGLQRDRIDLTCRTGARVHGGAAPARAREDKISAIPLEFSTCASPHVRPRSPRPPRSPLLTTTYLSQLLELFLPGRKKMIRFRLVSVFFCLLLTPYALAAFSIKHMDR